MDRTWTAKPQGPTGFPPIGLINAYHNHLASESAIFGTVEGRVVIVVRIVGPRPVSMGHKKLHVLPVPLHLLERSAAGDAIVVEHARIRTFSRNMQHYRTAESLLPAIPVPGIASWSATLFSAPDPNLGLI